VGPLLKILNGLQITMDGILPSLKDWSVARFFRHPEAGEIEEVGAFQVLARMIRWVKRVLMVAGAVALIKYGLISALSLIPDTRDDVVKNAYASPNGRYTAALVTRAGGGAIAPFCSDAVLVFNSLQTIDEVLARPEYQVYSGECDVFSDHGASPKLTWTSDDELHIDFAIGATALTGRDVKLRASAASGKVYVTFSASR